MEFNLDDIKELKRITQLELQGSLDPEGVKAFVEAARLLAILLAILKAQLPNVTTMKNKTSLLGSEAGGCLDGSQHLSLKDMAGKSGMKSLENATIGMKGKVKKPKGPKRTNGNTEDKEQDPNAKKAWKKSISLTLPKSISLPTSGDCGYTHRESPSSGQPDPEGHQQLQVTRLTNHYIDSLDPQPSNQSLYVAYLCKHL